MSKPWPINPVSLRRRLAKLTGLILMLALVAGWAGTARRPAQDRAQLLKGLAADARPKKYQGRTYHFLEKTWSGLYLVDDRTLLYGSEDALVFLLDHLARKKSAGPLQVGLQQAAQDHHLVLGLN